MATGQIVAYVRVSSLDQNEARQLEGLKLAGLKLDKIFMDKASGKDVKRPALAECLRYVREGDVLACYSIDRLARNLRDLQDLIADLSERGVTVRFIKENMTFGGNNAANPMQTLTLQLLGAFAEFERNLIRERQREGIALVKAKGGKMGRGKAVTPEQEQALKEKLEAGIPKARIAREMGISRQTVYNYARV